MPQAIRHRPLHDACHALPIQSVLTSRPLPTQIVVDGLHYGAETLHYYDLHAFVVMANHVHVLLTAHVESAKLLQSVKGFTAREANKILGRVGESFCGESFWQAESYDHFVRDTAELERIRRYIEENPVRAGLVRSPEEYRWSSAVERRPAPRFESGRFQG
jgi:putative transposase